MQALSGKEIDEAVDDEEIIEKLQAFYPMAEILYTHFWEQVPLNTMVLISGEAGTVKHYGHRTFSPSRKKSSKLLRKWASLSFSFS